MLIISPFEMPGRCFGHLADGRSVRWRATALTGSGPLPSPLPNPV